MAAVGSTVDYQNDPDDLDDLDDLDHHLSDV